MIFLLIKGDHGNAVHASASRLIPIEVLKSTGRETHALTPDENLETVRGWFLEDASFRPPYLPGSLLYYAVRSNGR